MRRVFFLFILLANFQLAITRQIDINNDSVPESFFITRSRDEYLNKLVSMPFGIKRDEPVDSIIDKIGNFLLNYRPNNSYNDDYYALESNLQAFYSLREGGYGIGAILIDSSGRIIARNHNRQIQRHRSDLHGEMTLLTDFEESAESAKYMNLYLYKPGLTVFSSAEPCPMCFIRLSTAGVDTKYCTSGPDDGMVTRINCLPPYWSALASKHKWVKANSSPLMQMTAHLLFYSFYLDNRGPE